MQQKQNIGGLQHLYEQREKFRKMLGEAGFPLSEGATFNDISLKLEEFIQKYKQQKNKKKKEDNKCQ